MSCKNPKSEFSAENFKTLETLGPKIQNSRNCTLRVFGGVLKEAVHSYAIFSPNVSVEGAETTQKGEGCTDYIKEDGLLQGLCNGSFKSYALKPC